MIWVLQEPRRPVADGVATIGREKSFSANARNAAGWFGQGSELLGGSPGMFVTEDRKSTRLNSSHSQISYAVFCLKKKKTGTTIRTAPPREGGIAGTLY